MHGRPVGMTALEFGTDGVLYGLPNNSQLNRGNLLTIDTVTASATDLGSTGNTELVALTSTAIGSASSTGYGSGYA